ncbi:kinesin-like protein KIF23 isoform X3 [Hydra vulgaris]|uniref:Kinesin-like protein n=1 Tax=Hydra vulgaris TaxID=6087 RepID=A0ABM4BBP6_HYDVU
MNKNGILRTRKASPSLKLKDPVEVFCRIRPCFDGETCVEIIGDNVVQLNAPKNLKTLTGRVEQLRCTFSQVFPGYTTQSHLFQSVGLPLVQDLLNGKNGLCFMYGISGSGKTHTMNGTPSDGGVLPRCLDVLFNSIGDYQASRCVFRPDCYNGFEVLSDSEASSEAKRKSLEQAAFLSQKSRKQTEEDRMADMIRIPDLTKLEVDQDNVYSVFISFVEIYNNSVFDLLEDSANDVFKQKQPVSKILREDQRKNMYVYEAVEIEVKSTEEAFDLFYRGQNRRKTAHTLLNTESSRSHSVFNIRLVQAPLGPDGAAVLNNSEAIGISQLSLCDLAGSERMSRTNAGGDRVREAGNINNSLMTLRSCIECLRENQKSQDIGNPVKIVPYRDSKLTHLFKNFFDGDGKVRMIVCLNPRSEDFDESIHVMKFAEMTQEVKVSRSDGVKFDLGLTPGRRNAMKAFKDTCKDIDDVLSSDTGSQEDLLQPIQVFAQWPLLQLSSSEDMITLRNLAIYLEERIKLRKTLYMDWNQRQIEVRNLIMQLEQDNIDLTKAIEEQRVVLNEKERESKNFEKKIRQINEKVENLQRSNLSFETQKRQAEAELEKQKDLLLKEKQEKQRLKQTLKDLTSSERLRWKKECDKQVRATKLEMEEHILEKSEKLKQLRDVVQNLDLPQQQNSTRLSVMPMQNYNYNYSSEMMETRVKNVEEEKPSLLVKTPRPPKVAAKPPTKLRTKTQNGTTPKYRSKSPPPVLNPTPKVSNLLITDKQTPIRSKHRRSRSSDYWLEHKPSTTLNTDTVMQPQIRKKKTVNTPHVKDFKKAFGLDLMFSATPNYILTHQEEDSCGEIETKLIKGEIMKTRGGGTSVQFTDVETLKKTIEGKSSTPKIGKRKSLEDRAQSEDSWTSVETRCAVGIEGKPGCEPGLMHHAKKSKN